MPARLTAALADRYRIERELGAGGMATVYLAHDIKHDRDVAIKVFRPDLAAALGAERFLTEVRIAARLDHPHILTLIDSGDVDGTLFYVMPLVRGESLRARLSRDKQLPITDAIEITRQLASALDYAHRQGVVHRDIKPENILLQEGEAILADFGIALALSVAQDDRITATGVSLGTPSYMSPEQTAGDRNVDARSDIYSLGAVCYEMLAGEPPVTGATAQALIAKLMTQRPTSLRVIRASVSPAIDGAVMRALAKAPADRFPTARAFGDALRAPAGASSGAPLAARRVLGAGLLLAVVAAAYLLVRAAPWRSKSSAIDPALPAVFRSIAVMPLDNYSADSAQAYFAEGMTDELTTDLATISSLRVISRGSTMQYAGRNRPPAAEIAKALNVDVIVEGSVTRVGDKVRITAQLIDARADKHLWAKSFERQSSDVLALQADLASAIASAINVRITTGEQNRLAAAPTVDPAAHDAYLKGRYFFARPSDANLKKAIAQFDQAVKLSPGFAPAWSGLSDAYLWAAFNEGFITALEAGPKAKEAAQRAVQLDSTAAEGHASLATYLAWFAHDWPRSEREFRRAIALNPNYAFAHDQFGLMLGFLGRFDESIAEGNRAMALDPLSPSILIDALVPYLFQHNAPAATALSQRTADLDPTFYFPTMEQGWLNLQVGKYKEAVPLLEKARTMDAPSFATGYLAYAYGKAGDQPRAMATLSDLKKMSRTGQGSPFDLALFYLGQGDAVHALEALEKAFAADAQSLVWLKEDAIYDPLRKEPRFIALMKKMHFTK